jgi:two-component system sensor histidine kinase KdpD
VQDGNAAVVAIRLGRAPIGSLAIIDAALNDTVLQSVTNLVAIGLERARGQAASARAEAARQNSELRATLLDAVAHEFKTPLTSLKAAASALRLDELSPDRRAELVDIVNEDLTRMDGLVSDAVYMLRIDAGDFVVRRERYRVSDIIRSVVGDFQQRLEGHRTTLAVPNDLEVRVDRALVQLALRQLLDNAIKYAPATASIELTATSADTGDVEIAVMNTGSHIPEHEQARVTERFYRGSHARHVAGTGMGLAIVRQIVEAHGGSLKVESTSEEGTRFAMSFPPEAGSA